MHACVHMQWYGTGVHGEDVNKRTLTGARTGNKALITVQDKICNLSENIHLQTNFFFLILGDTETIEGVGKERGGREGGMGGGE